MCAKNQRVSWKLGLSQSAGVRKSRLRHSALASAVWLMCAGGSVSAASAADNPGDTVNGLAPAKDPESGLTYMMPVGFFRRERPDGSTSVADSNGSHFSVDVKRAEFRTEADMFSAIDEEAQRLSDRRSEKNLKVHGCNARQWQYSNQLGTTKLLVIVTPKFLFECLWHADTDNDETRKACDTFFSKINPNCPKCNLPKG